MAKFGKRLAAACREIDRQKLYTFLRLFALCGPLMGAKFDETVESCNVNLVLIRGTRPDGSWSCGPAWDRKT